MLVVDTSAIIPFVLADEAGDRLAPIAEALQGGSCIAPGLLSWELANALWKALRQERLSHDSLQEALDVIAGFAVTIDPAAGEQALGSTLAFASRHSLTAYDAAYLELALRLGADLATFDADLRAAAIAEGVTIYPAL